MQRTDWQSWPNKTSRVTRGAAAFDAIRAARREEFRQQTRGAAAFPQTPPGPGCRWLQLPRTSSRTSLPQLPWSKRLLPRVAAIVPGGFAGRMHKAMMEKFQQQNAGKDFDRAHMAQMGQDHKAAVELFEQTIQSKLAD
jgi:hypothetical protein